MRNFEETLKEIKETIISTARKYKIRIEKIFLFGSRARGDFEESSDWDILIITKEKVNRKTKLDFWYDVHKKMKVPVDMLIVSKEVFEKYKESVGFVYRYVIKEGRAI